MVTVLQSGVWLSFLMVFVVKIQCGESIYVPNDDTQHQRVQHSFGVKTLGWQGNLDPKSGNVEVHHNYSKVHHINNPNVKTINDQLQEFPPEQQHTSQQQKINDNLDFSPSINDQIAFSSSEKLVFGHQDVRVYKTCPNNATGSFVYEDSCGQFLNCWKGRGHVQNCSPGTLFNPKTLECDYAEKVQCLTGPNRVSREIQIVDSKSKAYCPMGFSGLIPHYSVCSKYIQCNNGHEIPMDCAAGTIFDVKTNMCDFPYKSECAVSGNVNQIGGDQQQKIHQGFVVIKPYRRNVTYQINPNQLKDNLSYSGIDSTGRTYHILGHDQRQVRINDQLNQFTNQVPNSRLRQSDYLMLLSDAEIRNFGFDPNQCNNFDSTIFEHPHNCSAFIQCYQGKLHLGLCTLGTSFNPNSKICEYFDCQKPSPYSNQHQSSRGDPAEVKCPRGHSGLLPHPFNCGAFLNCDNGRTFIQNCGPGTVFNPKISVCDWPYNVQCSTGAAEVQHPQAGDRTAKIVQSGLYNQNLEISRFYGVDPTTFCIGKEGFYQNLRNCSNFFNCRNGKLSIGVCHQGSEFNPSKFDCDNNYRCRNQYRNIENQSHQDRITQGNQSQIGVFHQNQHQISSGGWHDQIDQNLIGFEQTTRPVLTTDTNADYIFDLDDLIESEPSFDRGCSQTDFLCPEGRCLKHTSICDGIKDCNNGEDEGNCGDYLRQFKQTKQTKMAVKEVLKFQNMTITSCAKKCLESDSIKCKSFNYRKNDGMCFILDTNIGKTGSLFSLPNYDYYENQKYSVDCTGKFVCTNQKCIESGQICDGKFDCVDKEDEKGCDAKKIGYTIKLVGSNRSHEGAIQVTALGKTGFVCDDQFSMKDAHVACKELGYDQGALEVKGNSYFDVPAEIKDNTYLMDDVGCLGSETSLRECNFNGWGVHNCMPKEVVGVICKSSQAICPDDKWKCETVNECIPLDFLCDHVTDCSDKSDEANHYCETPTEIRLVNGKRKSEGRIEIKYHGTWGTICDDDFNDDAAKVACRHLGYQGPSTVKKNGAYGAGKGPIWLDQVFCHGNETFLQECDHWDWGKHNCDHTEDVGVACEDYTSLDTPRNVKFSNLNLQPPKLVLPSSCGLRNDNIFVAHSDVHFRVVKGSIAQRGFYPWQASIRVNSRSNQEHWCGAVVISETFVLSAAHCLHGYQKGGFVVTVGDYDRNEEEGTEQTAHIEEYYIHPDFRKGTKMNNDIALVKLKGNGFNLGSHVQAICLPSVGFQGEGLNCTISGFGSVQSGKAVASKELRAGFIPIQTREVCRMPHIYGEALTEGMLCAGTLDGGIDACDGDSGGPLACLIDGVFTLVGLTSWGQHCGYANKPGVYVKIPYYRRWIDETMKRHL